jgi:hypothetical protein
MGIQLDKAGNGSGSIVVTTDTAAPFDCAAGAGTTTTTGPLTLTPLDQDHNEDGGVVHDDNVPFDRCTDYKELGDNALLGGLRDPFNPYDFFDVNGDGRIEVPFDILQVILAYNQGPLDQGGPGPNYSPAKDRGQAVGPAAWNRLGPDGHIDVPNDILGVILQYNHDCDPP